MKKTPKRFDMQRKPKKTRWYLYLVELIAAPFFLWFGGGHVKVEKAVKKMKEP